METQNVSAQLFNKQLPQSALTTSYGCKGGDNTCTDEITSDRNIENAFQSQLNLTEYYKSPNVFDTMKKYYTDQTIDVNPEPVISEKPSQIILPPPLPALQSAPVVPTSISKYSKESFGETGTNFNFYFFTSMVVLIIFLLAALIYYRFYHYS